MDSVKETIINSIKYVKDTLNFTLINEDWGSRESKCSCALGCVLLVNGRFLSADAARNIGQAADLLDVSLDWASSFLCGFDKLLPEYETEKEAYELGIELNNYFQPISHDDYVEGLSPEDAEAMMPVPGEIE